MVTFVIGAKKEHFIIHKEFACVSPFLEAAFNGEFIEGRTSTYVLEDIEPPVFRLFAQFLFKGTVVFSCHNKDPEDDSSPKWDTNHPMNCSEQDKLSVRLWVLGDRFLMPALQNVVLEQMIRAYGRCNSMTPDVCKYIYDNTSIDSPSRRLLLDQWAGNLSRPEFLKKIRHIFRVRCFSILSSCIKKEHHLRFGPTRELRSSHLTIRCEASNDFESLGKCKLAVSNLKAQPPSPFSSPKLTNVSSRMQTTALLAERDILSGILNQTFYQVRKLILA